MDRKSLRPSNQEDSEPVAATGDMSHQSRQNGAGVSRDRACGERRRAIGERGPGVAPPGGWPGSPSPTPRARPIGQRWGSIMSGGR